MARRWSLVLAAAIGLALVSLASNITTVSQLSGEADTLLTARLTMSKLVNAGTVWAGLAVLSGWLVRRPVQAGVAGIMACVLALTVHYGSGRAFGLFDSDVWPSNFSWFVLAVLLGGPLGVVGAIARRPGPFGLAARLMLPVAAVVEPFLTGMFTTLAIAPWPGRVSSLVAGLTLLAGGVTGGVAVLAAARKDRCSPEATS